MYTSPFNLSEDEKLLRRLAMKFRRTRDQNERQGIRSDYSKAVERLIESQSWREMPGPEDQLPSDWMPRAFFDYWLRG
jgi:hypothetical protein